MANARFSFPAAELPEGSDSLRTEIRDFLDAQRKAGRFSPHCSGWMVFDRAFSQLCGARGYIGMTWPKKYGGGERSPLERFVVIEELLAAGAPVGAHWVGDRQSGPQILRHGSEELREQVLPLVTRGDITFAIGMSEPDAGSDLANIRSRADKVDGGWRLNGRKIWTTNGHRADYMIGLFRTDPRAEGARHAGMTQFVVPLAQEGITRRPIRDLLGEEDFAEITFDDVFLPDRYVLGQPGEGWALVTAELAYERGGPERFLSVFPLFAETLAAGAASGQVAERIIGRLVTHLVSLREMSMSIAGQLAKGDLPSLEAAVVKDLGNALEREMPELLRLAGMAAPMRGADELRRMLAEAIMAAPSFTLRGGTPEVLRGIIARGMGLR